MYSCTQSWKGVTNCVLTYWPPLFCKHLKSRHSNNLILMHTALFLLNSLTSVVSVSKMSQTHCFVRSLFKSCPTWKVPLIILTTEIQLHGIACWTSRGQKIEAASWHIALEVWHKFFEEKKLGFCFMDGKRWILTRMNMWAFEDIGRWMRGGWGTLYIAFRTCPPILQVSLLHNSRKKVSHCKGRYRSAIQIGKTN